MSFKNLVSRWDMSDINPPDLGWQGNGNDGTGTGLVAATDIVDGPKHDKAIEFNGADEFVTIPHAVIATLAAGSIVSLVRVSSLPGVGVFWGILSASDGDDAASVCVFGVVNNGGVLSAGFAVYENSGGIIDARGQPAIGFDVWAVIGVSVTTAGNSLFINGEKIGVDYISGNAATQGFFSSVNDIDGAYMGATKQGGAMIRFLDGAVAKTFIYEEGLSELQHRDLYARLVRGLS